MPRRGASLESVRHCHRHYLATCVTAQRGTAVVVDVCDGDGAWRNRADACRDGAGARRSEADVWRAVFDTPPFEYRVAPLPGAVTDAPGGIYRLPLEAGSADIVLASQSAEHTGFIWRMFPEMLRILRPAGCIFLTLPSSGLMHRHPIDRYRFFSDPCEALADFAGCILAADWIDPHGPWHDHVGIFRHRDAPPAPQPPPAPPATPRETTDKAGSREEEKLGGAVPYLAVLARLHAELAPAQYLEIGVRRGASLALARGPAIGVDPCPVLDTPLPATAKVVRQTSDAFFATGTPAVQPDLAFIDGLHKFEYALRDFMNIECCAAPGALVVIDDVFPNHPAQAERRRRTRAWTGDIWRLAAILRTHRPDLFLLPLDTSPSGLLLVAGLDPSNRVLWDGYNAITRTAFDVAGPPPRVLAREGAVAPGSSTLQRVIDAIKTARAERCPPRAMVARLRLAAAADAMPAPAIGRHQPLLSLVVVGYNMPRELPRTIRSLSPAMQREIEARDYEVILIDNGSTRPADAVQLHTLLPDLVMRRMPEPTVSPVPAVNFGLSLARGDLVGVCIDGARMASPGLLSMALAASRLHDRPVIGTIGFHLGPAVQSESIRHGYTEAAEDTLLAGIGWEADGYQLFSIASLASSSGGGWFALPTESNAWFLRAAHWRALGGWDAGFVSPGGGLANHDTWARACADPTACVIMLLGEATFHQVHGGVATNNPNPPMALFHAEYQRLRGHPYRPPTRQSLYFGSLPELVRGSLAKAREADG
ncbi:MAG TPA: class I SAM-dependent methyltransferase [Acetobacteraceae bacterium]|nr:class I SAM-dependent methyltransferase [Acetobacteraceae bacterium]